MHVFLRKDLSELDVEAGSFRIVSRLQDPRGDTVFGKGVVGLLAMQPARPALRLGAAPLLVGMGFGEDHYQPEEAEAYLAAHKLEKFIPAVDLLAAKGDGPSGLVKSLESAGLTQGEAGRAVHLLERMVQQERAAVKSDHLVASTNGQLLTSFRGLLKDAAADLLKHAAGPYDPEGFESYEKRFKRIAYEVERLEKQVALPPDAQWVMPVSATRADELGWAPSISKRFEPPILRALALQKRGICERGLKKQHSAELRAGFVDVYKSCLEVAQALENLADRVERDNGDPLRNRN